MDARLLKASTLLALAFAAASLATAKNAGNRVGYLAKTGPVPLRFQPVPPPKASVPLASEAGSTNSSPAETTAMEPLNPSPQPGVNLSPDSPLLPVGPLLGGSNLESLLPQPVTQTVNSQTASTTANELLVVNPQMLIEYFKPMAGSTNGAGVSVLAPVNFTPATPSPAPSSRAIYKTQ